MNMHEKDELIPSHHHTNHLYKKMMNEMSKCVCSKVHPSFFPLMSFKCTSFTQLNFFALIIVQAKKKASSKDELLNSSSLSGEIFLCIFFLN